MFTRAAAVTALNLNFNCAIYHRLFPLFLSCLDQQIQSRQIQLLEHMIYLQDAWNKTPYSIILELPALPVWRKKNKWIQNTGKNLEFEEPRLLSSKQAWKDTCVARFDSTEPMRGCDRRRKHRRRKWIKEPFLWHINKSDEDFTGFCNLSYSN